MKKFYLFLVLMLTTISSVFAQEPTFTPDGTPDSGATWYYIQFQRGAKVVLSTYEGATGKNVMTAYASKEEQYKNQQLFKLVGTKDGFNMVSKDGFHFTFSGSVKLANQGTVEPIFTLLRKGVGEFDGDDVFQIQVKGGDEGSSFNPSGGPYVGKHIGLWGINDPSNPLKFVPEADIQVMEKNTPQFEAAFNANSTQWYQIMFITNSTDNQPVFQEMGEGQAVGQRNPISDKKNTEINKQLWQFVGSESEFELVNKNGMYAYYEEGRLRTSATSKDYKFTFKAMNKPQFTGLATQIINHENKGLNASGGVKNGEQVGAWDDQDINNSLLFIPVTMAAPEKINMIMVQFETEGEVGDAPLTLALEGATDGASVFNTGTLATLKNLYTDTEYTIKAEANEGYTVEGFTLNGTFTAGNTLTFTAKQGMKLSVKYKKVEMVELTIAQIVAAGRLRFPDQSGAYKQSFPKDSEVILVEDTRDGYKLTEVLVNGTNIYVEGQAIKVVADAPKTIIPKYEKVKIVKNFDFYLEPMEGGTVSVEGYTEALTESSDHYSANLEDDKEYTLVVTPAEGYELKSVIDRDLNDITKSLKFTPNTANTYLTVKFEKKETTPKVCKWIRHEDQDGNNLDALKYEDAFWGNDSAFAIDGQYTHNLETWVGDELTVQFYDDLGPDDCYFKCDKWELSKLTVTQNGETEDILATRKFIVKGDYTVRFELKKKSTVETTEYKVVIAPELKAGNFTIEGYTGEYEEGEQYGAQFVTVKLEKGKEYTFNVTANEGYELKAVTNMLGETLTEYKVVAGDSPILLAIEFEKKEVAGEKLSVKIAPTGIFKGIPVITLTDEEGNVLGDPSQELKVNKGSKVTLNVDVKNCIKNIQVNGTNLPDKDSYLLEKTFTKEFTVVEATTITVEVFNPTVITLGKVENGTVEFTNTKTVNGSICALPDMEVEVKATPKEGYLLKSIKQDATDITDNPTLNLTQGSYPSVNVVFAKACKLTKVHAGELGDYATIKFEGATDDNLVAEGNKVTLKVTAGEGLIKSIKINGTPVEEDVLMTESFTKELTISEDTKVEVDAFTPVAIMLQKDDNGTVTISGTKEAKGQLWAVDGTELEIKATPKDGYKVESIKIQGTDFTADPKITASGNMMLITVKFAKNTAIEGLEGVSYQVYPNPAVDFVELRGFAPNADVRLLALTGKTVLSTKTNFEGHTTLNVSDLARGLYLVRCGKQVVKLQVR